MAEGPALHEVEVEAHYVARYPGETHAEARARAAADLKDFIDRRDRVGGCSVGTRRPDEEVDHE